MRYGNISTTTAELSIHENIVFNSRANGAIHDGFAVNSLTYELLLISTSWFLRRYSCRYGYGRRYGDDSATRITWRRAAKNCAGGKFIRFFADEFIGA